MEYQQRKISKKTKKFKAAIGELHQKLGANYEKLKALGSEGGHLGFSQTETLADDLRKMSSELDRTLIKGPDTKAAQKAIEEALLKLELEGATIGDLVNTRINLGQQINWRNVDPKGAMLNEGRSIFMRAIEKSSPEIANELRNTDKAWAQYQKYADLLDKKQAFMKIAGIEVPAKYLLFGALAFKPGLLKIYATKEAIQRFSTAMLVNPKFQNVRQKLMQAVLIGDKDRQRKLMVVAQKILKQEDPELYDELDFGT